jgi:tight adherence protein B
MTPQTLLIVVSGIVAVSAALLAWFIVEVGTSTLARYRASFTERARFQVQEFFLFIDPRSLFAANLAVMGLGAAIVWIVTGSLLMAMAAIAVLAMLPRGLYGWMRRRRLRTFEAQLPDALMMISGGLRAGVGLSSAIQQLVAESAAPINQEFTLLLREQRLGVTLEQSLNNLSRRVPTTLVVSAMRIAGETGGGLAETLERTAHTVRSRLQMEGKIDALTAQGRLQAWVVGLLPVVLMLVLDKMEPEAMSLMWHTRAGWATLAVIALFEAMGIYVIRKIIAIDV